MAVSILFGCSGADAGGERREPPECFSDLNLDQIVAAAISGRADYDLAPIFHTPLPDVGAIRFRQEIFRDFDRPDVSEAVATYSHHMRSVRDALAVAQKLSYALQRQRWHLDAGAEYCEAVNRLAHGLSAAKPAAAGLGAFQRYLDRHRRSEAFGSFCAATESLQAELSATAYNLHLSGKRITVGRHAGESDYAAEVLESFAKFSQGAVSAPEFSFRSLPDMNHIEAAILERVAQLYPEVFARLAAYCERYRDFRDPVLLDFERGAQFYLAWLEYLAPLRKAGLSFCHAQVSETSKSIRGRDAFDLALAHGLIGQGAAVIVNDFELDGPERIMVVSGANQGGKTTFARMIGQMHYLAGLGCPVPGREARLLRLDRLFTHFARPESVASLRGKLEESLDRMRRILERATASSLLVMNESFDSTTLSDARLISRRILSQVAERDMLCVCVTFLDELASLSEQTVSFVAAVDPADPLIRTFKVSRRPAEGLAYAMAIARKHGLTYERVKERIAS